MALPFAPDDPDFYLADPHAVFKRLRAEEPLTWYRAGEFWCATKHADVREISANPKIFSSEHGTQIFEVAIRRDGGQPENAENMAIPLIQMDPPLHNKHRKLLIQGLTSRAVLGLEPRIREITRQSLDAISPGEIKDFVEHVAIPLPMMVIAELLGVPTEDRGRFRVWSDVMIEAGGGGLNERILATITEIYHYFAEQIEEHRASPRADILSTLLSAEVDGENLTQGDILMFCMVLLVAGNETTRNLISGGALALLENPDQKQRLVEEPELIPNAVEEMLRYVTPVMNFVRRATADTELRGRKIAKGDYVALFYGSANRDEEVFGDDADSFDVLRENASQNLAFGHGEHLCMGAPLARMEARVMFEELLARFPNFMLAAPAQRLSSVLINGVVKMPVVFNP